MIMMMGVVNVPSAGEQTVSERSVVGPGPLYLERAFGALKVHIVCPLKLRSALRMPAYGCVPYY